MSRSVPQTPSASVRTSTAPSDAGGAGTSSTRAEPATPGATVSARMLLFFHGIGPARATGAHLPAGKRATTEKVPSNGTNRTSSCSRCRSRKLMPFWVGWQEANMQPIGRKRWCIAEGYIPSQSSFSDRALISHETACILNAGDQDAHVTLTVFFADREPVVYRVTV